MSTQQEIKGRDEVAELYKKYSLVMNKDIYKNDRQNYIIVTRTGIESIQSQENIMVEFSLERCDADYAVMKAVAYRRDKPDVMIQTFGSAKRGEYQVTTVKKKDGSTYEKNTLVGGSTDSFYIVEMAEKRALSRAILKICGFYKHNVFGEDENHELTDEAKSNAASNKAATAVNQILEKRK